MRGRRTAMIAAAVLSVAGIAAATLPVAGAAEAEAEPTGYTVWATPLKLAADGTATVTLLVRGKAGNPADSGAVVMLFRGMHPALDVTSTDDCRESADDLVVCAGDPPAQGESRAYISTWKLAGGEPPTGGNVEVLGLRLSNSDEGGSRFADITYQR